MDIYIHIVTRMEQKTSSEVAREVITESLEKSFKSQVERLLKKTSRRKD
jgi:hypothetical protein